MKTFIVVLILAALMQASFLPINLVLLLLISRSLISYGKENLYLAFFSGILLGLLLSVNVGFYSLIFVIFIQALRMMRRLISSANFLVVIPLSFVILLVMSLLEQVFLKQSLNFSLILVETVLSLPVYILVRFWEERFMVAPPLKLKV